MSLAECIDVNIEESCDRLTKSLLDAAHQCIPSKIVTIRPNDKPWFNNYLQRLLRTKNRAHNTAKKSNNIEDWAIFRRHRNFYNEEVKRIKSEFREKRLKSLAVQGTENPKKWWSILKNIWSNHKDIVIPPINDGSETATSDVDKANAFNSFFLKAAQVDDLNAQLPLQDIPAYCLDTIIITETEVSDQLAALNINKAYGPDDISPRFLKEGGQTIVPALTKLFQLSLDSCTFDSSWKRANVTHLHKKNDRANMSNYRPVSLLSTLGKIMEKIIFKHVYNYLVDHALITQYQSGFLPGVSTVSQLTELYHSFCQALSKKEQVRVVFLDISKSFDKVWHRGLIFKLSQTGISGGLLNWFSNYLHDRQQRVIINGQCSDWGHICAGVPQGSVLGPLLFLIYINDLSKIIQSSQIRMFADDTCLFVTNKDRERAQVTLNRDLHLISNWAHQWLVTFSPPKTESKLVSNKKDRDSIPDIVFQGEVIKNVSSHKHLGVFISSDLKWNNHIEYLCERASKKLSMLKSLKFTLDRKSLETIYVSFIRPSLEYANTLWAGAYDKDLTKLDSLEVEAMRSVTGATAGSNIANLYKDTGWVPLLDRRDIHSLCLLYKLFRGEGPSYLRDLLPPEVGERTDYRYPLRNMNDADIPFTRLDIFKWSYFPSTLSLWNKLDLETRKSHSLYAFREGITPKPDKFEYFCHSGDRWAGIHHARIRIGCSKLKSHLHNNLHVIEEESCQCGHRSEDPFHFFFECPRYVALRNNLFTSVAQHTDCSLQTLLFGDPELNHRQNCDIFDAV